MNIDHGVWNSIYRTGRAAALRARLTEARREQHELILLHPHPYCAQLRCYKPPNS
jgi:hypothetical protein